MDGNEKLKEWGFWIHGCIDGDSRFMVYAEVRSNKTAKTVLNAFAEAVVRVALPTRVRGDYGTENNGVEVLMDLLWGEEHGGFIRGK